MHQRKIRQTQRAITPVDTPEIYYRRVISIPFLDEFVGASQFEILRDTKAVRAMGIVPSVIMVNETTTSLNILKGSLHPLNVKEASVFFDD